MPIYRVPVRIEYPQGGGPGYNVFHVRTVSNARDELEDALDSIELFYTAIRSHFASGTKHIIGEGMIRDPLGSPEYVNDSSRTRLGEGAVSVAPSLLAVTVSWKTSSATRSGRGRTFVGPFTNDAMQATDGTPSAALMSSLRSAANNLVSDSSGLNDWAIGVLSIKQGLLRDITGASVKDKWSYLSSRRD